MAEHTHGGSVLYQSFKARRSVASHIGTGSEITPLIPVRLDYLNRGAPRPSSRSWAFRTDAPAIGHPGLLAITNTRPPRLINRFLRV